MLYYFNNGENYFEGVVRAALDEPTRHYSNVAELGGKIIGCAQAYVVDTADTDMALLDGVAIARGYDGRGVATALLEGQHEWARSHGLGIFAKIAECNLRSREFFTKHGYIEIGRVALNTRTSCVIVRNPLSPLA